ncbi:hypothetical protein [Arthrobacter sp. UYEF3]|uniref:hypothetical protein n=1 Tax=Arthrobacter sp. UYEF3 TaxID=1756365 RepID=UPI00339A83B6
MGDTDADDVSAKVLECKLKGLSDFFVEGQTRMVRAFAVDPLSGRAFYLMLLGASGPDDFTFVEVVDGRAQDMEGAYVDIDEWMSAAPGTSINDFMEIVGSEMDDNFWDAALAAFLDLYATINAAISTALHYEELSQGEHMTQLCDKVTVEESSPGEDAAEATFQVFTDACERRRPFADTILVAFPDYKDLFPDIDFGFNWLPRVSFGYRFGQETEVAYIASGAPLQNDLFLNGFWTTEEGLEQGLLETYKDPWDRHGARNAARDLITIQSAATEFLRVEYANATKLLNDHRSRLAFEAFAGYTWGEDVAGFDRALDDKLREALSDPIRRVEDFLAICCGGSRNSVRP